MIIVLVDFIVLYNVGISDSNLIVLLDCVWIFIFFENLFLLNCWNSI